LQNPFQSLLVLAILVVFLFSYIYQMNLSEQNRSLLDIKHLISSWSYPYTQRNIVNSDHRVVEMHTDPNYKYTNI